MTGFFIFTVRGLIRPLLEELPRRKPEYGIIVWCIYSIFGVLLIRGKDDEDYVIVAYSISSFLGSVVTIYFVFREGYRFQKIKITEILSELKESFPFFYLVQL